MTIQEAYTRFVLKVNKNLGTNNISADKGRFVLHYNEEQVRRVEFILDNKSNDSIREIQDLLTSNNNLQPSQIVNDRVLIKLPTDYLDLSSSYAYVKTDTCDGIRMSLFEIKDFNSEDITQDANNAPSIEYREAPYYIGNGKLQIFTGNKFTVERVHLSYYRYPRQVDIEGYRKIDGTGSTNINPELDDAFQNKVISMCAEAFAGNTGDTNKVAIHKDKVVNNN